MRELSLNILDIAQNSIKAGAPLTQITVEESRTDDRLIIIIEDNGCGMTSEQAERALNPFYTTRTTRRVGLGIPLFKMAAEMAGGSFSLASTPGKGTVVRAEFVLTHIDRPPLGDLGATISLLIRCNPDRDFVYTRTLDGEGFALDTREMRGILGEDVPLNAPETMEWVDAFLRENEAELIRNRFGD